jgi:hypothetical protein
MLLSRVLESFVDANVRRLMTHSSGPWIRPFGRFPDDSVSGRLSVPPGLPHKSLIATGWQAAERQRPDGRTLASYVSQAPRDVYHRKQSLRVYSTEAR